MIPVLGDDEVRIVELHTAEGVISIELYDHYAPRTTEAFCRFVNSGQLEGAQFGRMVPGFVLECSLGDVRAYGELIPREVNTSLHHTGAGIVSCPHTDEETVVGSRFFITLGPQPGLDDACTIFGRVYSGMHLVEKISHYRIASETFRLYSPVLISHCRMRVVPKQKRPSQEPKVETALCEPCVTRGSRVSSLLDNLE